MDKIDPKFTAIATATGGRNGHTASDDGIVSVDLSVPKAMGARDAIDPAIDVEFPKDAPPLYGKPGLARYRDLARYMQQFDLVLSYNWGSMDGVMAHRLFAPFRDLPPLIHHEDGFNEDESVRRNWKRNAFRRLALPTAEALVVPSALLQRIAAIGSAGSSFTGLKGPLISKITRSQPELRSASSRYR